jgi:hypothetical protein
MQCRLTGDIVASLHLFFTSTVVGATPGRFVAVPIVQEAVWDPPSVWTTVDKIKSLAPTGFRTPNLPARSESLEYWLLSYFVERLRSSWRLRFRGTHIVLPPVDSDENKMHSKASTLYGKFCLCACLVSARWLQGDWKTDERCLYNANFSIPALAVTLV